MSDQHQRTRTLTPYYEDDSVTIYHGDCRDIVPQLSFDAVVTDPPYGISWSRSANSARNSKAHDGIVNDDDTSVRDETLEMTRGVPAAVFGSFYAPYPDDLKQVLVWWKPADAGVVGSVTGFRRDVEPIFLVGDWPQRDVSWSGVMRSTERGIAAIAKRTGHPHTKPLDVVRDLVDRCPPGVVLDPFMGSGTTLRAAKDLGRPAIGIEIERKWCEVAARRVAQEVLPLEAS